MNEPIKVIHKYKNNNRKIQYNVIIFVGNLLSDQTNKILMKIKDKNLYNTLTETTDRDLEILNNEYGNYWYKYFFIDKHINYIFNKIIKPNEAKKKEIINK
jgi:pyruvate dehydrogenase complex dehydrogenase (E1) component